jgi:non-specific protein-tyrosine kinase
MKASADLTTPIITITVRDRSPKRAAGLANAAAKDIVSLNQGDQSARYASLKTTLQKQIADTNAQLASASSRLRALSALTVQDSAAIAAISSLTTQVNALQASQTALNTQLNTLLLSQAQSNTVLTIVDSAQLPTVAVSPVLRTNLALALILGLALSIGAIMIIEYLDDSPRSTTLIESRLNLPVLSVISRFRDRESVALVAHRRRDNNAEAFKTLRTNIQFANVDRPPRLVLVASGRPSEGKSTVAANYAVAVAQSGKSVILVDCDLRRPSQQRIFGMEPGAGLTEYLRDTRLGISVARPTDIENLRLVGSGPIPPNPSELLGSQRMLEFIALASEHADLVVFDTPPALVVTDATVLAPHMDGIVLVLDEEKTKMRAAALTCQMFKMVGGKMLGIVVNKFDTRHAGYGGYYYYQYGGYYGADKDDREDGGPKLHSSGKSRTVGRLA